MSVIVLQMLLIRSHFPDYERCLSHGDACAEPISSRLSRLCCGHFLRRTAVLNNGSHHQEQDSGCKSCSAFTSGSDINMRWLQIFLLLQQEPWKSNNLVARATTQSFKDGPNKGLDK